MLEESLIDEIVAKVMNCLTNESSINQKKALILGKDNIELKSIVEEVNEPLECEIGMVTQLDISLLSHLALSCPCTIQEEKMITLLLLGKPVIILTEGIKIKDYQKTAPKNLWNSYQEYLRKLKLMGYQFMDKSSLLGYLNQKMICYDWTNKTLLVEKDLVEENQANIKIKLTKSCKITPLAFDYITTNQIFIERVN